jgi:hypothetical protein
LMATLGNTSPPCPKGKTVRTRYKNTEMSRVSPGWLWPLGEQVSAEQCLKQTWAPQTQMCQPASLSDCFGALRTFLAERA